MSDVEHWTIWRTSSNQPPVGHYIDGPPAGDWRGDGVEVVRADAYQAAREECDILGMALDMAADDAGRFSPDEYIGMALAKLASSRARG